MSLKVLAERSWLATTDTASDSMIDGATPEELYKLGFLNGLQATIIGATGDEAEQAELAAALGEAGELMESSS